MDHTQWGCDMCAAPTRPRQRPSRILLVDDTADNLALYAQYLTHADFEVHEARDGKEALDQARHLAPDLIVMDLGLPIMDGWEATRRLKADAATAGIPVIALTGHMFHGEESNAKGAGCAAFLIKPCLPEHLAREIRRVLRQRTARGETPEPGDAAPRRDARNLGTRRPGLAKVPEMSPRAVARSPKQPSWADLKVLIVEDHADSAAALRQTLEAQGARIRLAVDGVAALAQLAAGVPDLVLVDLRMPHIDGFQLVTRIRQDLLLARLPVLAVSAYSNPADLRATLEAGFDGHLGKPVDFAVLTATMQRLLANRPRRDGRRRRRRLPSA